MSEADAIGWVYTQEDIAAEDRAREDVLTPFEEMLKYHTMDEQEWAMCSNNEQQRLRWNYRRFGRKGGIRL